MLKLVYTFKIKKQNLKLTKLSLLALNMVLVKLINTKSQKNNVKIGGVLKTLMLSPFHYKVAKKNITSRSYKVQVSFNFFKSVSEGALLWVFKKPGKLITYSIISGVSSVRFDASIK